MSGGGLQGNTMSTPTSVATSYGHFVSADDVTCSVMATENNNTVKQGHLIIIIAFSEFLQDFDDKYGNMTRIDKF